MKKVYIYFAVKKHTVGFRTSDGRIGSNPIDPKENFNITIGRILASLNLHSTEEYDCEIYCED